MLTVNQIVASAILLIIIAINLPAIPKLFREIQFYYSHDWDFKLDSGLSIPIQDRFAAKFKYLPIGIIKLAVLASQVLLILMPFIAALNGYIARNGLH